MAGTVQPAGRHAKAPLAPAADGFAQGRQAQGGGVHGKLREVVGQGLGNEGRCRVLGLANRQGDWSQFSGGLNIGQQGAQLLEGVGV